MPYDPKTGRVTFPGYDSTMDVIAGRTGKAAPSTSTMTNSPSDIDQLAQVLSGNLRGTLSGGDKLLALSALLGSVARGSKTTPQEVMSQLQQQKATEIQNKMQIAQLRQQAATEAQLRAARDEYISTASPEEQRLARLLPLSAFADLAKKRLENIGEYNSAVGKEYQDRVRVQGKEAADAWLALQGEKFFPVTQGGALYRASDFMRGGYTLGAPAPANVTFTPVKTPKTQGGPTPPASGGFR